MNGFAAHYALFLAEAATLVLAAIALAAGLVALARRKGRHPGAIQVTDINRQLEVAGDRIEAARLPKKVFKNLAKQRKAEHKARQQEEAGPCSYLVDFKGDLRASAIVALREEITAILQVAKPGDAVLLRLESPGGMVNRYGLAAAQLLRLRDAQLPLTVMVDSVAASGGYLMAAAADKIVAAPFALIGSIGVIAQLPNFHRWLQARDIDWEQFTAGQYKRTVTVFGENTEAGRAKLREELEEIHARFREFVHERRQLDIDKVATGEAWLGSQALELGLVDELGTSDEVIRRACQQGRVLQVSYQRKMTLQERVRMSAQAAWDGIWQPPSPLG
ncbi:protease SohB [Thiobacillus sp. 65-1402]|uniref:protease SohB n=1 Tax=Thiobacillus sp. 65-1402 TaxID=1895861 RepID=UPI000959176B|nr:protease SohB [Thiobacillus sp. 65-1402]OJW77241.1 MAG: protease SohB [Thiobacillus sp. 65-1402]